MNEELQTVDEEVTESETVTETVSEVEVVGFETYIDTIYQYHALHTSLEIGILVAVFFAAGCVVAMSFWRR